VRIGADSETTVNRLTRSATTRRHRAIVIPFDSIVRRSTSQVTAIYDDRYFSLPAIEPDEPAALPDVPNWHARPPNNQNH
jgi:hypothetical protein